MSVHSLSALRYEAESRARKGLGWIISHVDELRPAAAMTRWTSADRARVAAAECAVLCPSFARLAPMEDRVFVVLLADWIERLAVPELVAWSRTGSPAWYRPLVMTAGALAEWGVRVPDLETAVRAYGPPTPARLVGGRPEHTLDTAYWWAKLRHTMESPDVDVACERELRRLVREPVTAWTSHAANVAIVCQSDFGKASDEVSHHARRLLERTSEHAIDDGHAELAAECAFAWWCLTQEWSNDFRPLLSCITRAQRGSGAFVPHARKAALGADETERCYHATLTGVLGCLAMARLLREYLDHDASSDEANTANAAQ